MIQPLRLETDGWGFLLSYKVLTILHTMLLYLLVQIYSDAVDFLFTVKQNNKHRKAA